MASSTVLGEDWAEVGWRVCGPQPALMRWGQTAPQSPLPRGSHQEGPHPLYGDPGAIPRTSQKLGECGQAHTAAPARCVWGLAQRETRFASGTSRGGAQGFTQEEKRPGPFAPGPWWAHVPPRSQAEENRDRLKAVATWRAVSLARPCLAFMRHSLASGPRQDPCSRAGSEQTSQAWATCTMASCSQLACPQAGPAWYWSPECP